MTYSHPYPTSYLYRSSEEQDIITRNIQRLQGNDVAMKRLSIHENLTRGHVLYLDGLIMHSIKTEFVDIPSPLPKNNSPFQSTN